MLFNIRRLVITAIVAAIASAPSVLAAAAEAGSRVP
jgi:hypothetical protein